MPRHLNPMLRRNGGVMRTPQGQGEIHTGGVGTPTVIHAVTHIEYLFPMGAGQLHVLQERGRTWFVLHGIFGAHYGLKPTANAESVKIMSKLFPGFGCDDTQYQPLLPQFFQCPRHSVKQGNRISIPVHFLIP